jgi:hypothetical protein
MIESEYPLIQIGKYTLEQTCFMCPEQYNVYLNDEKVAYLRLRHGHFTAKVNDTIVYEAHPDGDGGFTTEESNKYLYNAINAIDIFLSNKDLE